MIRIRSVLYKITFVFILGGIPVSGFGQLILGARGLGIGQAATALPNYEWSVFANPALIDGQKMSIGFYGLRNYGFAELTDIAAFATVPTRFGVPAVGFHRYGDHLFNETSIRVGYKNSWRNLHFGVIANYNQISFGANYGSGGALGINVGVAAEITNGLWIGARSKNVNMPQYKGIREDLPRELALGLSYDLNSSAVFAFDIVKDVRFPVSDRFPVSYRGGLEIKVIDELKGRVGVTTNPTTYAFGLGYGREHWQVNLAVQKHTLLDFSPGMDMIIYF